MAVTVKYIQKLMQRMTMDLAKKDDLNVITKDITATNDKVTELATNIKETNGKLTDINLRMTALERKVAGLENKDGATTLTMITSGASRTLGTRRKSSASASANIGDDENEWRARMLHFHGWAPYGSGDTANLKREAEAVQ